MQTLKKRIDKIREQFAALDWYYPDHIGRLASVNVKIHGGYKDIDEVIADTMKRDKIKPSEAVEVARAAVKEDESDFFWRVIENEQRYAFEVIFDGCRNTSREWWEKEVLSKIEKGEQTGYTYLDILPTSDAKRAELGRWIEKDSRELGYIAELGQFRDLSGFYGRSGGHFCIGYKQSDAEDAIIEAEDIINEGGDLNEAREIIERLERTFAAIQWGLDQVKEIADGVPSSIEEEIESDFLRELDDEEERIKREASPAYKIDRLRDWERTLAPSEREAVRRSIVSIEKTLQKSKA
jgi:uncharacterized protein YmfQ (DUF2313 family)